jgi:predicted porin
MKRLPLYIAACAMSPLLAFAQSSVTIYGIIDTGVEYANKQAAGGHVQRVVPGVESGSRLGFRGTEDLGGGLRALFNLESGLNTDDGTYAQGGLPFGREAWVGLAGSWGQIVLGRTDPALNVFAVVFDPLGRPSRYSSPNIDPLYAGRINNMVSYSATFGSSRVMAMYGLGEVTGSSRAGSYRGAYGSTVLGDFTLGLAYDDQPGATAALAGDSVKRTSLGGLYRIGITTLAVGYTDRRNNVAAAPSRVAQYWLGARAQLNPQWYVAAAYYAADTKDSPNKASLLSFLATYALSKRTDVYMHVATTHNSSRTNLGVTGFGTTAAGESQQGVAMGVRHLF